MEIGSIVHLKSGSPDLTIVDVSGHYVMVSWKEKDGSENRRVFNSACLVAG